MEQAGVSPGGQESHTLVTETLAEQSAFPGSNLLCSPALLINCLFS